jgi:aromatic-L-amino-acid decarboxylase
MIRTLRLKFGDDVEETTLLSKLMAYCSKEAHSCVEKAAMIGFVKLR